MISPYELSTDNENNTTFGELTAQSKELKSLNINLINFGRLMCYCIALLILTNGLIVIFGLLIYFKL
jgi:hypothetical protein